MICSTECLGLYSKEIILQGHGNAEGQELSGLSTSEHSQVHWDDELMQSLSSMSSASDPTPHFSHPPYFLPYVLSSSLAPLSFS